MGKAQKEKRERGRPKKEEDKLCRSINLKLTKSDYETIEKKAARLGMKPTPYAREMTLKGTIKSRYTTEELDLRRKIAGMCNNVNQLLKRTHSDGCSHIETEAIEEDEEEGKSDDWDKHAKTYPVMNKRFRSSPDAPAFRISVWSATVGLRRQLL